MLKFLTFPVDFGEDLKKTYSTDFKPNLSACTGPRRLEAASHGTHFQIHFAHPVLREQNFTEISVYDFTSTRAWSQKEIEFHYFSSLSLNVHPSPTSRSTEMIQTSSPLF